MTDTVLNALLLALNSDENDANLLLHIAKHLATNEQPGEALPYFQRILALDPVHPDALNGALAAANLLGNVNLANGYQTLLASLGLSPAKQPVFGHPEDDQAAADSPTDIQPKRVRGAVLRLVNEGASDEDWVEVEDSNIYLRDVGGMENVKRLLNLAFLAPLKNPELMKAYGKNLSGGLLLYGPPGCGKTYIAKALAGELGAKFISVGLTDILDMYVGQSEKKLHEIFESARRNTPAVLFFDELDALGQKRNQLHNSGTRSLVNQLLSEMDSMNSNNDNLFILGATNHPWDIDSALRRPGRFDRVVPVFPPDLPAREAILNYHLQKKPTDSVDTSYLASQTDRFSGADLRYLCDSAVELAIESCLESGEVKPLVTDDFSRPLQEVKPSTLSWFETARNFAMFANESGTYDELMNYIRDNKL